MKKGFLYYYTLVWIIIGGLYNLYDFLAYVDSDGFWAVAVTVPSIYWLLSMKKK